MTHRLKEMALPLAAIAVALLLVLAGLTLGGYPPLLVLQQWTLGGLGTKWAIAASLQEACPLLLTGLAAAVAFRCGVLNIGAEGQFMTGALAVAALTTRYIFPGPAWLALAVAIAAAALAGAAWAFIAGALEHWRGVPVVLSTILLNFVAVYLAGVLLLGPLQAAGSRAPQTPPLPDGLRLPILLAGTQLHGGVIAAFAIALLIWLVQARTVFGFELLLTGINPTAAELSGIPIARRRLGIICLSGACAGLAGAFEVTGVTYFMTDSPMAYGYAGIAVALLGRLNPLGVAAAALFFGVLDTGARRVEKDLTLHVPHSVADIMKGVIILAMLIGTAWLAQSRTRPKQSEGPTGSPAGGPTESPAEGPADSSPNPATPPAVAA